MESLDEQVAAFARWLSLKSKPRTVEEYARAVRRMMRRVGADDVRALTRERVVDVLAGMPATKTRVNDYMALLAFCRWAAVEARLIASPLIDGLDLGRPAARAKARTMRPLSTEDVRRLIAVAEEDERAVRPRCREPRTRRPILRSHLYAVMAVVGGRWREMCGPDAVRWSDVDWTERTLTFRAESAKGRRTDVVPLLESAVDALRRWQTLCGDVKPDAPIWPRVIRIECLKSDARAAGLPERVDGQPCGWHSFRHGLGVRLAATTTPTIAQRMLRHRDVRMTMQVYAQVDLRRMRTAVEAVDDAGRGAATKEPATKRYPQGLTQALSFPDNDGVASQATPSGPAMGVTGLEPVRTEFGTGSDLGELMELAAVLAAAVRRMQSILVRLQAEPGNGSRPLSSPPPPPSAG